MHGVAGVFEDEVAGLRVGVGAVCEEGVDFGDEVGLVGGPGDFVARVGEEAGDAFEFEGGVVVELGDMM